VVVTTLVGATLVRKAECMDAMAAARVKEAGCGEVSADGEAGGE
jgi:hypothetical protein